jgi:hypothetical protein
MQRSLVNIPTGIRGIILHDVKLEKKDYPKDRICHIIVTVDDGAGKSSDKIRFYIASGRVNNPRLDAVEQNLMPGDLKEEFDGSINLKTFTDRDALPLRCAVTEAIVYFAADFLEKGYTPVYNERYSYRQKDTDTSKTYRSFKLRRSLGVVRVYFQEQGILLEPREVKSDLDYWNNNDVPVIPLAPVAPSKTRLSKEDWLKANYPEMSELPKWRFPGLAG